MRILQVITSLRNGGAERLVAALSIILKSKGCDIDIAVLDGTPTPLMEMVLKNGIKVLALSQGEYALYSPMGLWTLWKLMKKYDVVHSHNTMSQYFTALASSPKGHLVTTEHSITNRRRNYKFWEIVDRWMYEKYECVVCLNDSVKDALMNHCDDSNRIKTRIIHNGVKLSDFQTIRKKNRSDGKIYVTMAAGFRKEKDQKTLIKAFSYLPSNFYLQLAGDGETQNECREIANSLHLDDRIVFLGNCDNICELLSQSQIGILSTHQEGESIWALEVMAAGLPLIATDLPVIRGNMGKAAFLVQEDNPHDMAEAIWELGSDYNLWRQFSELSKNWVANYDIESTAEEYLSLYKELTNTPTY